MATNSSLKNQLQNQTTGSVQKGATIKGVLDSPAVKKRFEEVLNKKAPQFMSSIVNLVNSDSSLQKCEQLSVISSCMVAATLDLPVDRNLGYAWVVPYGNKAQFQIGYKGFVQLALRTGQYKSMNVIEVHEGELIKWNPLTEELELDFDSKKSEAIVGYAGYFELLNGFKKSTYWSKEQIEIHKNKFAKSAFGWNKDFHAMAKKTVLKNLLSKWGILSIEMQQAQVSDGAFIKEDFLTNEEATVIENVEYAEAEMMEGTPFEEVK